ncbi:hypothetical protein H4219_002295 [Mycoemilia scoparia]|uniref:Uncharacterized protein n=1 Tax=Mycoemilia scoparia TaxID=417184 RepID=A0A9W8A4F2_9FUNG|nr:hypothetical protein H4219_002295 [Mycoemilia scoparia]
MRYFPDTAHPVLKGGSMPNGTSSMEAYWDRWSSWHGGVPSAGSGSSSAQSQLDEIFILRYRMKILKLCRKIIMASLLNMLLITTVLAGIRRATGWTFAKPAKSKSKDKGKAQKNKKRSKITIFQRYLLIGEATFEWACGIVANSCYAVRVDKDKRLADILGIATWSKEDDEDEDEEDEESCLQSSINASRSPILNQISFGAAAAIAASDLSNLPPVPETDPPAYSPFDPMAASSATTATATTTAPSAPPFEQFVGNNGSSGSSTPISTSARHSLTAAYGVASASPADFWPTKNMTKSGLEASSNSSI